MEEGDIDSPMWDMGIMESIANFFLYGWHPGSCAWAILANDEEAAFRNAHVITKIHVKTMIALVHEGLIPDPAIGSYAKIEAWADHEGYSGAPATVKTYIKLGLDNKWLEQQDRMGVLKRPVEDLV